MMDWGRVYLWTLPFTAGWQVMAAMVNFATDDPILAVLPTQPSCHVRAVRRPSTPGPGCAMIRWWRQRRHVHTWRGVLIYDAIRWTCDECGKTKAAWPQGLSDGSVAGSVAGPRAEEEGMDGRWFVRLENGKLPVCLGDDYRRRKSLAWPSDDDLTEPP